MLNELLNMFEEYGAVVFFMLSFQSAVSGEYVGAGISLGVGAFFSYLEHFVETE